MALGRGAQAADEAGVGHEGTLHGVDDDGRELCGVLCDQLLDTSEVVVRGDQQVAQRARAARADGLGRREVGGVRPAEVGDALDVGAVERAVELHQLRTLTRSARDPDARERRLASARHEAQPLDPGVERGDPLGQLNERRAERRVVARRPRVPGDGLRHARMGVADQGRAPRHRVVEVLAPLAVPDAAALGALEDADELGGQVILAVRACREKRVGAGLPASRRQLWLLRHPCSHLRFRRYPSTALTGSRAAPTE